MKKVLKQAFIATVPIMAGYIVLGFGFGIILKSSGYGVLLAFLMSLFIYAGSMQYVAVNLLCGGASFITTALTALMVNARHVFYGISMLDKYRDAGKRKPYLIFALSDETYSLVCRDNEKIPSDRRIDYCFAVSLFNHAYWILGSVLGAVAGSLISFNTEGVDFALTALFLTVFIDQLREEKKYLASFTGVGVSVLCLIIFGADAFLIPSMLIIALLLCFCKDSRKESDENV